MSVVTADMLEPIVAPTFPLFPLFWIVAVKYYFPGRKVISTLKGDGVVAQKTSYVLGFVLPCRQR